MNDQTADHTPLVHAEEQRGVSDWRKDGVLCDWLDALAVPIGARADLFVGAIMDRMMCRKALVDAPVADAAISPALPRFTDEDHAALVAPLIDAAWYVTRYGHVDDPVRHYVTSGHASGRAPNRYFDPVWYVGAYPDVRSDFADPLLHYVMHGEAEDRHPGPFFDPRFYARHYGIPLGGGQALAHYLSVWADKTHSPNAHFDIAYYCQKNPDVATSDIHPEDHFRNYGHREYRDPSATFDLRYYKQRYMQSVTDIDPVTFHLTAGQAAGYRTQPHSDDPTQASEIRRFVQPGMHFEATPVVLDPTVRLRTKVMAFYLPQFHRFPENDAWWGPGFTEWTNVARGTPRFAGHQQPRVPRDLGFYDLTDRSVLPRQVEAALAAGLSGFCYYYYNFNGRRLLHRPLDDFLDRPEIDAEFCLMWANENWSRRWDGSEDEVLIRQDYCPQDDRALIKDLIRYISDKRYMRVAGRPVLLLYRPGIIPDAAATIARWRGLFAEFGENPFLVMAQAFDDNDPRPYGLDGAFEFPPHKLTREIAHVQPREPIFDPEFKGKVYDYSDIAHAAEAVETPPFPLFRTVCPSWDNDARRQGNGLVLADATPPLFHKWLQQSIAYARENPVLGEEIVFVNAWNEWAEGAYLEPDVHNGYANLNAIARGLVGYDNTSVLRKTMLLVGHDMFPAGAQMLLLAIGRMMREQFGFSVRFLLLDGGDLAPEYHEVGAVVIARSAAERAKVIADYEADGGSIAITNTVATADVVKPLRDIGIRVVSLVHEMPGIIAEKGLLPAALELAAHGQQIVFASKHVLSAFEGLVPAITGEAVIRPQGIYQDLAPIASPREKLCAELGLGEDARFVLAAGFADFRKGIDLFCRLAQDVGAVRENVHFIWAGQIDPVAKAWFVRPSCTPNLHFLGARQNMAALFAAADAFVLTSREDPFPSVVLEAMAAGLRVTAFEGAGGFVDLLRDGRSGEIVPFENVGAMVAAVLRELDRVVTADPGERRADATAAQERFAFDHYVFDLLQMLDPDLKRVSVVVPNYNYAHYLAQRLTSIFNQSYPVFEVIVLDDSSSDNSVAVIKSVAQVCGRRVRTVVATQNSGSVFKQWSKAAKIARGDLIWIAEADDVSDKGLVAALARGFADPDVTLAFSDSRAIDSDGRVLWPDHKEYYASFGVDTLSSSFTEAGPIFAARLLNERNVLLNASAVVWRRDVLRSVIEDNLGELLTYRVAGDWFLYVCVCERGGKVFYESEPLNSHRRHEKSVTLKAGASDYVNEIARMHDKVNQAFSVDMGATRRQQLYVQGLTVPPPPPLLEEKHNVAS